MIPRFPRKSHPLILRPISTPTSSAEKRWHLCNSILRASIEKGSPCTALLHFRLLLLPGFFRPDHRTLTLVLEACRRSSNLQAALSSHARITKSGLRAHFTVLRSLFDLYCCSGLVADAQFLFVEMPERDLDPVLGNLLIAGYLRLERLDNARTVFDDMAVRDVVSWNTMIAGCARFSRPREAMQLFDQLCRAGFEPDEFTFSVTLSACAKVGAREHGELVHSLMMERKVGLNYILSAALIDMYAKCGRIEKGMEIFDGVSRSNASIWNSMISGFAIHGLGHDAIHVFSMMEKEGVIPDSISFVGLLTACSHSGLVKEGRHYFDIMKHKYSIEPLIEHYGAMVDLLARAGHLQEAYETIKAMPLTPDIVVWRSLLSASRIHWQPEMAEIAISEMVGQESGDYVLLSSIYSLTDRWRCAERVWEEMKGNKIRKARGLSWVELHGTVHEFKAGDRSHAESDAIYMLLKELTRRAKENGYASMTRLVNMDVSEEEKEENLYSHSEKLAVTYGILRTVHPDEIMVSKNLRACVDCHSWLKVVSSILCRVIIVRDRIRFHRFEKGSCSCKDYW